MDINEKAKELSSYFDEVLGEPLVKGASEYTKSIFMSKALEDYVFQLATKATDVEYVKQLLKPVIKHYDCDSTCFTQIDNTIIIPFITFLEKDFIKVLFEELWVERGFKIEVIPGNYNDRKSELESPFTKPNNKIAYRYERESSFEIHFDGTYVPKHYRFIVLTNPEPIILHSMPIEVTIKGMRYQNIPNFTMAVLKEVVRMSVDLYKRSRVQGQQPQQLTPEQVAALQQQQQQG